jgi:hypothetical protein
MKTRNLLFVVLLALLCTSFLMKNQATDSEFLKVNNDPIAPQNTDNYSRPFNPDPNHGDILYNRGSNEDIKPFYVLFDRVMVAAFVDLYPNADYFQVEPVSLLNGKIELLVLVAKEASDDSVYGWLLGAHPCPDFCETPAFALAQDIDNTFSRSHLQQVLAYNNSSFPYVNVNLGERVVGTSKRKMYAVYPTSGTWQAPVFHHDVAGRSFTSIRNKQTPAPNDFKH